MRVFVTGSSGWIGTALTRELVAAGHEARGLVRSEESEESGEEVRRAGVTPVLGRMEDHDLLVAEAVRADATAHLAFTLDFTAFDEAVEDEVRLLEAVGVALEGTGKALFAASGTPTNLGDVATEEDELDPQGPAGCARGPRARCWRWRRGASRRSSGGRPACPSRRSTPGSWGSSGRPSVVTSPPPAP